MRPLSYREDDYETPITLLLAERGSAAAQFNVGMRYATGTGVPQDYAMAASWYRKAADQRIKERRAR